MKNDKTIIITLVFVLISVVVFFNLEKFTGQATKTEMTKLYVSHKADVMEEYNPVVKKGDYVYFTQMPGTKGGAGTLYIKEMDSERKWEQTVRTQKFDDCNSRICRKGNVGTLKFKTYHNWEGKYCGEVKDLATWKKVTKCFTVE